MPGSRSFLLALSLTLAVASIGCVSRTVVTTIPHPMQTGQISQNRIAHEYRNNENNQALPAGTLSDSAEIVRMDAEAVCFDVLLTIVDDGDGQTWTDLRNWEITLDLPGDQRMVQPNIQLADPVAQQYDGRVRQQVQTGIRKNCLAYDAHTAACVQWEEQPVYEWQWVPGVVTVVSGGGGVCFGNQGFVTTGTSELKLNLHRTGRTIAFEWEFASLVGQ